MILLGRFKGECCQPKLVTVLYNNVVYVLVLLSIDGFIHYIDQSSFYLPAIGTCKVRHYCGKGITSVLNVHVICFIVHNIFHNIYKIFWLVPLLLLVALLIAELKYISLIILIFKKLSLKNLPMFVILVYFGYSTFKFLTKMIIFLISKF